MTLGSVARGQVPAYEVRSAAGAIDGLVADTSLAPIDKATISILRTTLQVETGPSGRFRIVQLPPGQYLVIARRIGFRPISGIIEVTAGDTLRVSYTMEPAAAQLDTVHVNATSWSPQLEEFYERKKIGLGEFMSQEDIDRRNSMYASDLMRGFKSIHVVSLPLGGAQAVSARTGSIFGKACSTQVFLDGVRLPVPVDLDLLPSPKELAGIEVYAGPATVPLLYGGSGARCGVILVWTKRG